LQILKSTPVFFYFVASFLPRNISIYFCYGKRDGHEKIHILFNDEFALSIILVWKYCRNFNGLNARIIQNQMVRTGVVISAGYLSNRNSYQNIVNYLPQKLGNLFHIYKNFTEDREATLVSDYMPK